ncbi:MAG: LysR family transcriptional regulator, partial [Comamonadaceae bacterium]
AWLSQQPLIMNEPGSRMQTLTMEWFARAGFAPRARIEHNYDTAMCGLVEAGYGAALLPILGDVAAYASARVRVLPLAPRLVRHLVIGLRAGEPRESPAARVAEALLAWKP